MIAAQKGMGRGVKARSFIAVVRDAGPRVVAYHTSLMQSTMQKYTKKKRTKGRCRASAGRGQSRRERERKMMEVEWRCWWESLFLKFPYRHRKRKRKYKNEKPGASCCCYVVSGEDAWLFGKERPKMREKERWLSAHWLALSPAPSWPKIALFLLLRPPYDSRVEKLM